METKNLAKIAKRGAGRPPSKPKTVTEVIVEKPKVLSPEEERKIKIKETVDSLLDNVDLTNPHETRTPTVTTTEVVSTVQRENTSWLEEQINKLTVDNEALSAELLQVQNAYDKLYGNMQQYSQTGMMPQGMDQDSLKPLVIGLFNEIQGNMLSMGVAQQPFNRLVSVGESLLVIHPLQFLNRMVQLWPFLANERKF